MEPEQQFPKGHFFSPLFKVTTVSKYLALFLFILLPFVGGLVGYVYAPEKVVEVERVVENVEIENSLNLDSIINDVVNLDKTKHWSVSQATSSVYIGEDKTIDNVKGLKLEFTQFSDELSEGLRTFFFTDALRELWSDKYEVIVDADGLPTRDLDVYRLQGQYIQVKMDINFAEWSEEDVVEPGSMQEAFGKPESVTYEVFVTSNK